MGFDPILNEAPVTNVFGEHIYKIRATFGNSSAVTFRSKDAKIATTTTTTFTVTLPCPYNEITEFSQSWKKAVSADPLTMQITTDNLATAGTLVLTSISTNSAGTATAPASGDVVYLTIGVSRDLQNNTYTG